MIHKKRSYNYTSPKAIKHSLGYSWSEHTEHYSAFVCKTPKMGSAKCSQKIFADLDVFTPCFSHNSWDFQKAEARSCRTYKDKNLQGQEVGVVVRRTWVKMPLVKCPHLIFVPTEAEFRKRKMVGFCLVPLPYYNPQGYMAFCPCKSCYLQHKLFKGLPFIWYNPLSLSFWRKNNL